MTATTVVGANALTIDWLVDAARAGGPYALHHEALNRIRETRVIVDDIVASGVPAYGINTGVGSQKDHSIDEATLADYNRRLVRGHATRVPGTKLLPDVVRGAMLVLLSQFASGHAGVSPELAELVARHSGSTQLPVVDAAGSVGASDLVPLSQLADWLLSQPDAADLPRAKDALALINCNAVSLAAGAFRIVELRRVVRLFDIAAAATMEGFRANLDAIDLPVNAVHRRKYQADVAADLRSMLAGSSLWNSGEARLLQDPLSFRNVSQIHGALREAVDRLIEVWNDELNSVAVNPIVHEGDKACFSHGNMDTTRATLALDSCRQAVAKVADVSGERIQKIQWPNFSGLPIGLASDDSPIGGVQFLNLGHIAASVITSIKIWAQPHLLHSVGQLADGVEDTASHALHAVYDLERQLDACRTVAAIEIAIAVWAIDRRGLRDEDLGAAPRRAVDVVRPLLPIGLEGDEVFDVAQLLTAVENL